MSRWVHERRAQSAGLAVAIGLAMGVLAVPPLRTAVAQETANPQARATFERGVAALDDGRFSEAASALEESYRLRPARVVLNNLGVAYRGLGRYREAIDVFQRYLADPPTRATADELGALRREIERLQGALARLRVLTEPATATVLIDGHEAGRVKFSVSDTPKPVVNSRVPV